MATEIVKGGNVSDRNPKNALGTTGLSLAVGKQSDLVSAQTPVNESKDAGAESGAPSARNDPIADVLKRMKRAERFGMPVQLSEKEKRYSRAERFGSAANSNESDAVKSSEDQKRKARAERFGLSMDTVSDEEAKKKARLTRFAATSKVDNVEDDKRKARALRFSQPTTDTVSKVKHEEKLEPNAAVAGGAA